MCTAKATAGTMQMPGQDPDSAFTPTEPAVPPHKQDSCGAVREKSRWASGHSVAPESTAKPLSSQAYGSPCIMGPHTKEEMGFSMML